MFSEVIAPTDGAMGMAGAFQDASVLRPMLFAKCWNSASSARTAIQVSHVRLAPIACGNPGPARFLPPGASAANLTGLTPGAS